MEASLNGCGKLLDKINALHTTFAAQPEQEYEDHGTRCRQRTDRVLHSNIHV
jgi:hypothetical protein